MNKLLNRKLKSEDEIKAFMKRILQLIWNLGYTSLKAERRMASMIKKCKIVFTTEDDAVSIPVESPKGKTQWVNWRANSLYIPPPYFKGFFICHAGCCVMVLRKEQGGVDAINVVRLTVQLLSLGKFKAKRGYGLRNSGYAKIRYYRGAYAFVQRGIENTEFNDAMLDLATVYLAKQLSCFACLQDPTERLRTRRQLLQKAEQHSVTKLELIRGVFQMTDPQEIYQRLKEGV